MIVSASEIMIRLKNRTLSAPRSTIPASRILASALAAHNANHFVERYILRRNWEAAMRSRPIIPKVLNIDP